MLAALAERGLHAAGVPAGRMTLYHLVGRDTTNPDHPHRRAVLAAVRPAVALRGDGDSRPVRTRNSSASWPLTTSPRRCCATSASSRRGRTRSRNGWPLELDEFERGYPRMTLSLLLDVVGACLAKADRPREGRPEAEERRRGRPAPLTFTPFNAGAEAPEGMRALRTRLHAVNVPGQRDLLARAAGQALAAAPAEGLRRRTRRRRCRSTTRSCCSRATCRWSTCPTRGCRS